MLYLISIFRSQLSIVRKWTSFKYLYYIDTW